MLGNAGVYALKRRKKPVQKNAKPPPAKTNPSKRHRDRLNGELDRLTSLLPFSEEVRGRLDKLSVLRLSVGYLKVKSYFHATLQKNPWSTSAVCANGRNGQSVSLDGVSFSEGELLLQALNGFVVVVTTDGMLFYTTPTIQDLLGFHQSDVVHQSIYDVIHVDDREMFKCQLHFAFNPTEADSDMGAKDAHSGRKATRSAQNYLPQYIPPENSSFLDRNFCCRLRCLLDNTSGFLALNFNGRLKYLHSDGTAGADGTAAPPQLALFAIVTPVQPPAVMEIRTKTLIFQTKHRMDFAPIGVDTRGKLVLGFSETELVTTGSGYQFIHAADMMYCADNHLKMIKTGDTGFTFFRLLTKTGCWLWVQANARVVFKAGKPDFIIARQKPLTNEEGEEHLLQRRQQLPFNVATGESLLYDMSMEAFSTSGPPSSSASGTRELTVQEPLDPASLLGSLLQQDPSVYAQPQKLSPQLPCFPEADDHPFEESQQQSLERAFMDSHALLSVPGQQQSSQKTPSIGNLTSQAMIDSLEQILGSIGDGEVEGLDVDETELRDWENIVIRMNKEREDTSVELNRMLANDVFSYVEEELSKESGGYKRDSHQTGSEVSGTINTVLFQGQYPGTVLLSNHDATNSSRDQNQCQIMKDMKSGDETVGDSLTGLKTGSGVANSDQGHMPQLWHPGTYHYDNQMLAAQSCYAAHSQPGRTDHSWLQSTCSDTNSTHHSGLELTEHNFNQLSSQQPYMDSPLPQCGLTVCHQQQLQPFHHPTPAGANSAALSLQHSPHTQRSSSSCMYEKREADILSSVPARQNGFLLGTACSGGPTHTPFTLSHPDMTSMVREVWPSAVNQTSSINTHIPASADVGIGKLSHLSVDRSGLGTSASENPAEHGSLQSSFFCWNGDGAQIPSVPLNGIVDPFALPAVPAGSSNLSQSNIAQLPLHHAHSF